MCLYIDSPHPKPPTSQGGPRVIFNHFYLEKYTFAAISEEEKVSVNVRKTGTLTLPVKTIEITTKHLILCSSINNMWVKTLKTPNKLAGPVGKEGVLGGVNRWRNAGKTTENITEPVTK